MAYRIYDRKHICSLRVNVNSSVPKPFIFPAVLFLLFTLSLLPVPVEMPGPPTNIAISNISPRSVTLQFKPGYDGKTSISRWLVEAQVLQKWDASSISFKASHSLSVFISHRWCFYSLGSSRSVLLEKMRSGLRSISWPMSLMHDRLKFRDWTPTPITGPPTVTWWDMIIKSLCGLCVIM